MAKEKAHVAPQKNTGVILNFQFLKIMTLTSKGSSTVNTSLINNFTGSNFTFSNAIIQDTSGGTVNTAAKLQTTVSNTDKATAPPAWAVC